MQRKANPADDFSLRIVLPIIIGATSGVLIAMGAARYHNTVTHAREAVLAQDLKDLRKTIQDYTYDKGCLPSALDDLISAGYLHEIPIDPMTKQRHWTTSHSDILSDPELTCTGIDDVNSSSNGVSPFTNTPYSSW